MIEPVWMTLMALCATIAVAALVTYVPALVLRERERERLRRACAGRLVLTYDDGPGEELTPRLLDLLERHGVRATFYLVGFRARTWPSMCDRIVAGGHEIGTHTDRHRNAWRQPPWRGALEVHAGYRALAPWLQPGALFRPPFGKVTTWSWLAARRHASALSWWTIDSGDSAPTMPAAASIARQVVDAEGGVVLMHCHDRGEDRTCYVLEVTEQLIAAAHDAGLEVCTYGNLLEERAEALAHA
jgi:peptidoglycan/xylan/chitin deacetylase (PgdA/CDA1 family)